jgi:hypothetical protein
VIDPFYGRLARLLTTRAKSYANSQLRRSARFFQEEGGYEETAYHPVTKGQAEAHAEEGLLYQPIEGSGEGQILVRMGGMVRLCTLTVLKMTPVSCARYTSLSSEIADAWHWVKRHVHKLVATAVTGVSTLVVGAVAAFATGLCGVSAVATADPFEGFDCAKIGLIGWSVFAGGVTATIEAWKHTRN